jgi:hypothetical protein
MMGFVAFHITEHFRGHAAFSNAKPGSRLAGDLHFCRTRGHTESAPLLQFAVVGIDHVSQHVLIFFQPSYILFVIGGLTDGVSRQSRNWRGALL